LRQFATGAKSSMSLSEKPLLSVPGSKACSGFQDRWQSIGG